MKIEEKKKKVKDSLLRESAVGMMIEGFEGHLKLLAESFDAKFGSLEKKMTERFDEMKVRFDEFDKNQKITLKYLFKIDDEILDIKKKLEDMEKNDASCDKAEFGMLKTKIFEMEKEMKKIIIWKKERQKSACA
jgi:hypothetical protein